MFHDSIHDAYISIEWEDPSVVRSLKKSFPIPLGKRRRGLFSLHPLSPVDSTRILIDLARSRGPSVRKFGRRRQTNLWKAAKAPDRSLVVGR